MVLKSKTEIKENSIDEKVLNHLLSNIKKQLAYIYQSKKKWSDEQEFHFEQLVGAIDLMESHINNLSKDQFDINLE